MVILSKNVHWLNVAQVHWLLYADLTNGNLRERKSWPEPPAHRRGVFLHCIYSMWKPSSNSIDSRQFGMHTAPVS
jgi:hypothetical protein